MTEPYALANFRDDATIRGMDTVPSCTTFVQIIAHVSGHETVAFPNPVPVLQRCAADGQWYLLRSYQPKRTAVYFERNWFTRNPMKEE